MGVDPAVFGSARLLNSRVQSTGSVVLAIHLLFVCHRHDDRRPEVVSIVSLSLPARLRELCYTCRLSLIALTSFVIRAKQSQRFL